MDRLRLLIATCCLAFAAWTSASAAQEAIWFEGEQPSGGIAAPWSTGSADHADYISGGSWLQLQCAEADMEKTVPPAGLAVGWDFTVAAGGKHEIWERYALESIRTASAWRLDGGAWTPIPVGTQPYVDLMDPGFFCELCWTHLGDADLTAGRHRIEIQAQRAYAPDKKPARICVAVDCFCISSGHFVPNGRHQAGDAGVSAADQQALAHVFTLGADPAHTDLNGTWAVCRFDEFQPQDRLGPDKTEPADADCHWGAIPVPASKYDVRPDLDFAHRIIYRTHVEVPAGLIGHGFQLHFPAINMIGSVLVNGTFCGWTKAMLTDWYCDITPAVKAGVNQVDVVIKDTYYAFSPAKANRAWSTFAFIPVGWLGQNWFTPSMDMPVASQGSAGLIETPVFETRGAAYGVDCFAQPSVSKQQLAFDLTVRNPSASAVTASVFAEIDPHGETRPALSMPAQSVSIPAGGEALVHLVAPWKDAKLWWPDSPVLYDAVSHDSVPGKPEDVHSTTFGFREWGWSTDQFTLNGIPWHFHADQSPMPSAEDDLKVMASHHQNMVRFWAVKYWGMPVQDALDVADRAGMVVRHTGIFDGEGANYMGGLNDQALFDNWTEHLKAWVKAERNHPSLLVWSIENEITFINSRNLGLSSAVEPMVAKSAKVVMELDPTRPAMVDGGRALVKEDMPVNGCHYDESDWRRYPEEAYTYELAYKSHEQPWNGWGKSPWRLVPNRPVFHGEAYYLNGYRPGDLAQWGGDAAFTGWIGARHGAGLFAKILSEGYRWRGIAAFHFWMGGDQVENYYNSWSPVAVLVRQWDSAFAGGATIERAIKVFNDTHDDSPIVLEWSVEMGGKPIAGATKTYQVACGTATPDTISFTVPKVSGRTLGHLVLQLRRGGAEVFHDSKDIAAIDAGGAKLPALNQGELAVFDPKGVVVAHLKARGLAFTELTSASDIPESAKLVIVGPDALDPIAATGTQWMAVAARGGRVLVLDQANPLQSAAVPADMVPSGFDGRVAFSENLEHPAFASLDQTDFFTWSGDEMVYRNVYSKPTRGAISLVACDQQLGYTALAECRINDGVMMLCQLEVGTKLASNPVAQRLFDNLVAYCAGYTPLRKSTAVVLDPASGRGKLIASTGLVAETATDALAAVRAGKAQIVLFDATPANLAELAGDMATINAFTKKGGWLFAWGLTPEGLASFNTIVGVDHVIRPFRRERVTLPAIRDPVESGLTMRDVVMDSGTTIASWTGQRFASSDSYSYVVDYDEIAPFCTYPSWKQFNPDAKTEDQMSPDHNPFNLTNGFTGQDDWRYIFQISTDPRFLEWDVTLPRPEQLTQLDLIDNSFYRFITRIELTFDGDATRMTPLVLKPLKDAVQSFPLPEKPVSAIHVKLAAWEDSNKPPVIGIDNWWIRGHRSPEF